MVVVDVDNARFRRDALGGLMRVVDGRQPATDVEELADALFDGQVADGPGEEPAIGASRPDQFRHETGWRSGARGSL